ncbi:helix-turn-helix domain-containing protein [Tenacibaculum amylolyticum]|uniref:helix-turn-helix domain-containing protein n=1 Tax=Tenacibaculum amylolyticum TaxID=104269 RepID=UPI003893CE82
MEVVHLPEDLNIPSTELFSVYDYTTPNESFKQMITLHQNTFSFLIEGYKEVFANEQTVAIKHSHFLLMKKGRCLMTEKLTQSSKENYRSILFFFSNKALTNLVQKHQINYKQDITSKTAVFSFKYDEFIRSFVHSLIAVNKLKPTLQAKLLTTKFEELITYLIATQQTDFIASLLFEIQQQNQRFIEIVEANKLNKLTIKELAFLSNMSVSTFKRAFEKHFKSSPSKWFLEKRLEHAAFLLQNQSIRPSDIFEEIGYESLSNFVQAFKTKFGVTPKQYQLT